MSEQPRPSVEMESIVEHTFDGKAYKPGDRFPVHGDGGGWSAEMFADSLTALGHAKRAAPKPKVKPKGDDAVPGVAPRQFEHQKPTVPTVKK